MTTQQHVQMLSQAHSVVCWAHRERSWDKMARSVMHGTCEKTFWGMWPVWWNTCDTCDLLEHNRVGWMCRWRQNYDLISLYLYWLIHLSWRYGGRNSYIFKHVKDTPWCNSRTQMMMCQRNKTFTSVFLLFFDSYVYESKGIIKSWMI